MESTGTLTRFPCDFSDTSPSPLLASPGFLQQVADSIRQARNYFKFTQLEGCVIQLLQNCCRQERLSRHDPPWGLRHLSAHAGLSVGGKFPARVTGREPIS
jgi:hypothetical protein